MIDFRCIFNEGVIRGTIIPLFNGNSSIGFLKLLNVKCFNLSGSDRIGIGEFQRNDPDRISFSIGMWRSKCFRQYATTNYNLWEIERGESGNRNLTFIHLGIRSTMPPLIVDLHLIQKGKIISRNFIKLDSHYHKAFRGFERQSRLMDFKDLFYHNIWHKYRRFAFCKIVLTLKNKLRKILGT